MAKFLSPCLVLGLEGPGVGFGLGLRIASTLFWYHRQTQYLSKSYQNLAHYLSWSVSSFRLVHIFEPVF